MQFHFIFIFICPVFLFSGSDDDEKEKQPATPKKFKSASSSEPQPSTSGLVIRSKRAPTTTTTKRVIHGDSSEGESSAEERAARPSKPTTRQRKTRTRDGASVWSGRTNATDVLDFSEEGDAPAGRKEKSVGFRGKRSVQPKGGGAVSGETKTVSAPSPVEDSLVTPSFSSISSVFGEC